MKLQAVKRWLRTHPFLTLGIGTTVLLGGLLVLGFPAGSTGLRVLAMLWKTLGAGPYVAANLLARWAPGLPGWLDTTLVVVLGLLPYAAADWALAQFRERLTSRRQGRLHAP